MRPGIYRFDVGEDEPVLTIRAEDAVVDFAGVTLVGPTRGSRHCRGVGVRVLNSRNVTVTGVTTEWFQVGIHVLHSTDVVVTDASTLRTRQEALGPGNGEAVAWLDLYDKAAWRHYGVGVWFERCEGGAIVRCTASHAQNGIALDKTDGMLVIANDCRRNTGWGIHLDRACRCRVIANNCSGCGGELDANDLTAGIAINNGCHDNEIISNDISGCSTGLLLTAEYNEQSNGNVIASNEASSARFAGLRCTFSDRNRLANNRVCRSVVGILCEHARETIVEGNIAEDNTGAGIVLRHGRSVEVTRNRAAGSPIGIHLGRGNDSGKPPTECRVTGNVLAGNDLAVELASAHRTLVGGNIDIGNGRLLRCSDECVGTENIDDPPVGTEGPGTR